MTKNIINDDKTTQSRLYDKLFASIILFKLSH